MTVRWSENTWGWSAVWRSCLIVLLGAGSLAAQGFPPEEAAQRMAAGRGLTVSLYASEPLVRQPVAIEFDARGRLWVIQYLQYPNPEGLQRVKVDRYSRTIYDKQPEPPPRGPQGADRITILEDKDGDGHAESAKDFVTGLNLATGLAFGHGGVFVLQTPYLLFYPDRDADDVPDGDPEVLVTGFGMEDAHSIANSLTWGPDGWLYGCQGSTVTARIGDIEFQQGVWRYHPLAKRFELFCEGGGNSWGLDFDEEGQLLYSTNVGGFTMLHGVQGAYYWKSFGKHGALHNPYAYGYFDHVPHENFTGGHVTVGGVLYGGTALPELRGKYVAGDLLGHAVYWHHVEPNGATFRSRHGGTVLQSNDTWFAPTDVTVGPDGALYVTDWHDQRTAHPDPDADWDRRNGRIYRIAAPETPLPRRVDPTSVTSDELVALLASEDSVQWRWAQRQLADRHEGSVRERLEQQVFNAPESHVALRSLWTLYVVGGWNEQLAERLLDHALPAVRTWAVRLLGDEGQLSEKLATRLVTLAEREPDVRVRSQLACSLRRWPAESAVPILFALTERREDSSDPYLPLLLWWGLEQHALAAQAVVVDYFTSANAWRNPLVSSTLQPRLMQRFAAENQPATFAACVALLASTPGAAEQAKLLEALDLGLASEPVALPAELAAQLRALAETQPRSVTVLRLLARTGDETARRTALRLALEPNEATPLRLAMLRLLAELREPSVIQPLRERLTVSDDLEVQRQLLQTLARFDDPSIGEALLAAYPQHEGPLRAAISEVLLGRRDWAALLLASVEDGRIAAAEIPLDHVRQVAVHGDKALDALVRKHWGRLSSATPEEKLAEVRRLNNDLRAASGDFEQGRELFKKHCSACHRLGALGELVGPELTHANRQDRQFLLVSLVDPSSVVRKEYTSYVLQTNDGRVLTGVITAQTPQQITLVNNQGQPQQVARDDIESLDEAALSLMPENLLTQLTPQQLRDLFTFLEQAPATPAGAAQN